MADINTSELQPGTKAYAGARADARERSLQAAIKRVKKGRGEPALLAKAAAFTNALIEHYDRDAEMTDSDIVNETEVYFGSIVSRLNAIADVESEAKGKDK